VSLALDRAPAVPAAWLTPRPAKSAPVHRWFVFPHSYAPQLVEWTLDLLDVRARGVVLDPFCGAGTTLVEAQRLGFRAVGTDLLPLAVLASRAKTKPLRRGDVVAGRQAIVRAARSAAPKAPPPPTLNRALTPAAYGRLASALRAARGHAATDCLSLSVLSAASRFSALVADGGWLRRVEPELASSDVPDAIAEAIGLVEEDIELIDGEPARVEIADARRLPLADSSVDAVITSPPYPNRHDYTRVFAVELELGFGLGDTVKDLRYQALSSHPEARPRERPAGYAEPETLHRRIREVTAEHPDGRIPRMLRGYFEDMFAVLSEVRRVLVSGGGAAFVVGNAQYCGVSIPVDEHLADVAEQVGLRVEYVVPLRLRGNSAQQMAAHGRRPSRESAVVVRN
jgi:tRNA G10  N-methylase Trm11